MTTPVTTLDKPYSDLEAVATGWDETRQALNAAQVFWISTVRADGRPPVTRCAAVWRDGTMYFDTGATQQKAVAMLRDLAEVWATRWDGQFQFVARDGCFHHA